MSLKMLLKTITFMFFVLAFVQLCFIDTEFSIADNGDFSRYCSFWEKPCNISTNWPAGGTIEWNFRFFKQPNIYWDFRETPKKCWFTSAHLFWNFGKTVNQWFFNSKVFVIKNVGLLFYLIHASALVLFAVGVFKKQKWFCFVILPILFLSIDAGFSQYYNSFYAESLAILFLQCVFCYVTWLIFFAERVCCLKESYPYVLVLAIMTILVALAKRQYLPFCLINILFASYLLIHTKFNKQNRILKILVSCMILIATICSLYLWFSNFSDGNQNKASHINNRHALYYGVLTTAKHPKTLIRKLDLPEESIKGVGYSYWGCPCSVKPTMDAMDISFGKVLKGFALDPIAFLRLYYHNLSQVLQIKKIGLGSVPYEKHALPPVPSAVYSSILSCFSGEAIFFVVCGFSILLYVFSFGLDSSHHNMLKTLLTSLWIFALADVVISTFDGKYEVTKHIMVANFCIAAIYALFFATLGNLLHQLLERKIHIPFFSPPKRASTVYDTNK